MGGLNNKYLLPTVLKAGESKIKVLVDLVPGKKALFPFVPSCYIVTW